MSDEADRQRDSICTSLYRDRDGIYYLQREAHNSQGGRMSHHGHARENAQQYDYQCLVHRIGINAAILWAVGELGNGDPWNLRVDAGKALMRGSGHHDPKPVTFWHDAAADTVIVPLTLHTEEPTENENLSAEVPPNFRERAEATGHTPEQVIWMLTQDFCAKAPKRIRIITPSSTKPADDETELPTGQPGAHRFSFEYPATERHCGLHRVVELTDTQMERARELSTHFDLTPTAFIRAVVNNNDLPGQFRRTKEKFAHALRAADLAFVCTDEAKAGRIERAAQSCGRTVDEFVADAVGRDVDMYEENMLVHPTTGQLLESDFEEIFEMVANEVTDPPVGQENNPQWNAQKERQVVLRLSPERYAMVEKCADGQFADTIQDFILGELRHAARLNPVLFDGTSADAAARWDAAGKKSFCHSSEAVRVELNGEAAARVRRYLNASSYPFTAEDVVFGAIEYALEMALEDLENESNHAKSSKGRTFADDGWGYVEEVVYNTQQRRLGLPDFDESNDPACEDDQGDEIAAIEDEITRVGTDFDQGRSRARASMPPPPAIPAELLHSLNAAAPEAVSEEEIAAARAERQGQPEPIRVSLLTLAADWRAEAAAQGGNAGLALVRCALTLEEAVAGKEGK